MTNLHSLRISRAERWHERMLGLLARDPLDPDEALWICPCRSVHTIGMGYPLDIVFLDREGEVMRMFENVNPFHMVRGGRGAHSVLEMRAGEARRRGLVVGQRIVVPDQ